MKKILGNVTAETDVVFGYQQNPNFKAELPEQIPFQVKDPRVFYVLSASHSSSSKLEQNQWELQCLSVCL